MRWEFISTSTAPLSGLSGLPVETSNIIPPPNASFSLSAMNDQKTLVGTLTDAGGTVSGLEELYGNPMAGIILNNLLE